MNRTMIFAVALLQSMPLFFDRNTLEAGPNPSDSAQALNQMIAAVKAVESVDLCNSGSEIEGRGLVAVSNISLGVVKERFGATNDIIQSIGKLYVRAKNKQLALLTLDIFFLPDNDQRLGSPPVFYNVTKSDLQIRLFRPVSEAHSYLSLISLQRQLCVHYNRNEGIAYIYTVAKSK